MEKEHLTLKWGTLKSWHFESEDCLKLLEEYEAEGMSFGAMSQKDTPRQKEIICELIDKGSFKKVYLDWDGKYISKAEARKYVKTYGED